MKKLVFIKLGGSVITDKTKPLTPDYKVINQIAKQIKKITTDLSSRYYFVIGHGAGSFGHYFAQKYNTPAGVRTPKEFLGFSIEQFYDVKLNQIILKSFLDQKINAQTFYPSSMVFVDGGKVQKIFLNPLLGSLKKGIIPLVYGNVVFDTKKGCHIFSTESIFREFIHHIHKKELIVEKVIYLTTVGGFIDSNNHIISKVTSKNYPSLKKHLYKVKGFDVTGGMRQKVEEALNLAKKGIKTHIVNGLTPHVLSRLLIEKERIGTSISLNN